MATERDESSLFDLLMALNADNGFGVPVSSERVLAAIQLGTRQRGGIIGVIDGPDGRIMGSISLVMAQFWYSDAWFLQEGWVFVRPEARASHHYRDLFLFANWARLQMGTEPTTGRPWLVQTSVWSLNRLPAKLRLWARFGRQVGGIFLIGQGK
jgi:hypothetical protein